MSQAVLDSKNEVAKLQDSSEDASLGKSRGDFWSRIGVLVAQSIHPHQGIDLTGYQPAPWFLVKICLIDYIYLPDLEMGEGEFWAQPHNRLSITSQIRVWFLKVRGTPRLSEIDTRGC